MTSNTRLLRTSRRRCIGGSLYVAHRPQLACREDYDKAIGAADQALALLPQSAEAFHARGLAEAYQQKYPAAIADFTSAIAIEPRSYDSYTERGSVYIFEKDYDRAIDDLSEDRCARQAGSTYLPRCQRAVTKGDDPALRTWTCR